MYRFYPISVLLLLFSLALGQTEENLKAFPPAEEGMIRYVLQLPEQPDESTFQVELVAGKTVQVDQENRYFFGGSIEKKIISGFGYPYYFLSELGPMAGTLMAVDPDAPKIERYVTLGGGPYLVRYNSRLPIVVYVPREVEVRYRIWSTVAEFAEIEEN